MQDWKMTTIAECSTILGDGLHGTPKYDENGEYAFINGNNLHDGKIVIKPDTKRVGFSEYEKHKKELTDRTVLVSINGTLGNVAVYNGEKVVLGKSACYFNVSNDCDVQFMRYVVSSPRFQQYINSVATGTTIKNVSLKQMREYSFPIPELKEQQRIAKVLHLLDQKIENNQKINDNLEQQVMALFRKMFIETSCDARQECRADEYFDISIGKTPPRKEPQWFSIEPTDRVWVSISDMGSCGMYIADSSEYLTHESVEKFNVKVVPDNTVLLSFKLTVGRVAITDGAMTTNEAIAHFKTDKTEITEYLYCYLKGYNYQTMGSTSSIATAVNSKIIKAMPFIIPTDDELAEFHAFAAPMFAMIKANQRENARLAELRDSLLPRLMSGDIDVSDIDA